VFPPHPRQGRRHRPARRRDAARSQARPVVPSRHARSRTCPRRPRCSADGTGIDPNRPCARHAPGIRGTADRAVSVGPGGLLARTRLDRGMRNGVRDGGALAVGQPPCLDRGRRLPGRGGGARALSGLGRNRNAVGVDESAPSGPRTPGRRARRHSGCGHDPVGGADRDRRGRQAPVEIPGRCARGEIPDRPGAGGRTTHGIAPKRPTGTGR